MKTIAVIAELNPCHNGHARFLSEARAASGADSVIVLMSGDFVQRGEPAIYNKYVRTRMALAAGADLVLELPVACATGSAPRFAEGAVGILNALGVVDELWFGSECGQIGPFLSLSSVLEKETDAFRAALQEHLANGDTYPSAREKALVATAMISDEERSLLQRPNNTLGLAYVRALHGTGSTIAPKTLARFGSDHEELSLSESGYGPASAIRSVLRELPDDTDLLSRVGSHIPESLHSLYTDSLDMIPLSSDDFSDMLLYALEKETAESLSSYLDVPEDLARRIKEQLPQFTSFSAFADLLKTRERTLAQVRRALLHILLGIRKADIASLTGPAGVRVLGHARADALLSEIHKKGRLPLWIKGADLSVESYARDLFASQLYEAVLARKCGVAAQDERRRFVITTTQP